MLFAEFGAESSSVKIVITTPISGWFECAGERGTGVALAIALAEYLSSYFAVELVLASGHELGYLGGFKYTESLIQPPAAVIHLGSSLATINSALEAWSNVDREVFDDLDKKLRQKNINLNRVKNPGESSDWVGEAECWSHFNCSMLSIAGSHALFHSPEDRIALTTNKEELTETFELLIELATIVVKSLNGRIRK